MRERRHRDVTRPLSPPRWTTGHSRRDRDLDENRRFSNSYWSRSPIRSEPVRARLDGREYQRYGGDVRTQSPPQKVEEMERNRWLSSSNRTNDSDRVSSVRKRDEDRRFNEEKLSQFCDAVSRKGSTFNKFQWDSLLGVEEQDNSQNASTNLRSGPLSDSGVVPTSMSMENVGHRTSLGYTTRNGNCDGVINERNERKRRSIVDPIVDMIDGRMLEDNRGACFGERYHDHGGCSSGCYGERYHDVKRARVVSFTREKDGEVAKDRGSDHGEYSGFESNNVAHLRKSFVREKGNMGSLPIESSLYDNMENARLRVSSNSRERHEEALKDGEYGFVDCNNESYLGRAVVIDMENIAPLLTESSYENAQNVRVRMSSSREPHEEVVKDCRSDCGPIADGNVSHLGTAIVGERGNLGFLPVEFAYKNFQNIGVRVSRSREQHEEAVKNSRKDYGLDDSDKASHLAKCAIDSGNLGSYSMESSYENMLNVRARVSHSREQFEEVVKDCRNDYGLVDSYKASHLGNNFVSGRDNMGSLPMGSTHENMEIVRVLHSREQDGEVVKDGRSDYGVFDGNSVSPLGWFSNGRGNMGSPPIESPCENMRNSGTRTGTADPIVDMLDGNDVTLNGRMREIIMSNHHCSLQERYIDGSRVSLRSLAQDVDYEEALCYRNDNEDYGMEARLCSENSTSVEECGFERHGCLIGSYGDDFKRLPVSYEGLYVTESSPQGVFIGEELGIRDSSEIMLEKGPILKKDATIHGRRRILSFNGIDLKEMHDTGYGNQRWAHKDIEQLSSFENSGFMCFHSRSAGGMIDEMARHGNANSFNSLSSADLLPLENRHSIEPVKPPKSNVKERLGPLRNVKQRLGPVPNSGKSMSPAQKPHRKLPWVKIHEARFLDDCEGALNVQRIESSKVTRKKHIKTELHKDSDMFLQQVQKAFFKFCKLLNENSANRRKYLERGGSANLKCCVCGSNSKEFADTLSLAQHAIMSCKDGSSAEHLGLHKALCVLLGWNSAEVPNSPWVRQILPDVEASSLKEDLVLWPPVVFIHNNSIANDNPDERVIVSIEELRDILRGLGFGQGMTNVCRGKAANQSTMVVSFSGTFSGLQGAENLHRLYAENKRGRAEFQQIGFRGYNSRSLQTERVSSNTVESVLYGYLGIASDLDKLDFETKKRCVVKSKKEIRAITDASLNTE